jgi:hypothetical protein
MAKTTTISRKLLSSSAHSPSHSASLESGLKRSSIEKGSYEISIVFVIGSCPMFYERNIISKRRRLSEFRTFSSLCWNWFQRNVLMLVAWLATSGWMILQA